MNYWQECISEALDEVGIEATADQIAGFASCVEGAHETYEMMHGHESIRNPLEQEILGLKKELREEKNKVICPHCTGSGTVREDFLGKVDCSYCNGEGRTK